jgi:hypothetical protein
MAPLLLIAAYVGVYAHEHKPPHNGVLVECGDEFAHLELLADPDSGKLTAYVLDGEAEEPVRLKQSSIRLELNANGKKTSLTLKAVENPLTGEVKGDTSEFSVKSEKLKGVSGFSGMVALIKVKGVTFRNVKFAYPEGNKVDNPSVNAQEKGK